MNKSVEYIKNRIINDSENVHHMPKDGWENVNVTNPLNQFSYLVPKIKPLIKDNQFQFSINHKEDELKEINVRIKYNPDAQFDYFTMETSTHDGTFLFTSQCIGKVLDRLLTVSTYAKNKVNEDFYNNTFDYDINYIIGDIVIHSDFGMKNINGNDWHRQTDIVILPIKFECFKKEN